MHLLGKKMPLKRHLLREKGAVSKTGATYCYKPKKPMKSKLFILLISLTLLLTACGGNTPEAIPTVVLDAPNSSAQPSAPSSSAPLRGDIVASAIVVPAQQARLAFLTGGNVTAVNVIVGSSVKAGDVLIELDSSLAQLDVERAQRALRELTSPAAVAAAEEAVVLALETRDNEADDVVSLSYGRATQDILDEVKAEITLAKNRVEMMETAYKRVSHLSLENSKRADALLALNNARSHLSSLQANYQWYISPPSEVDVAKSTSQAAFAAATYQEAQWHLAVLKGEDIPADASGAKLAQLQQAQADLIAAQKRLEQTRLVAPFAGVVAQINVSLGEFVSPSQLMAVVSDLKNLQVKTTDLSERDILRVQLNAPAEIAIDALGESFAARVLSISPLANTLGGDVVYEVTLVFEEDPAGIFGGMTAEVAIDEITE